MIIPVTGFRRFTNTRIDCFIDEEIKRRITKVKTPRIASLIPKVCVPRLC